MTQEEITAERLKSLALNDEQKVLLTEFNTLIRRMLDAKIRLATTPFHDSFVAINCTEVLELTDTFDMPDDGSVVDIHDIVDWGKVKDMEDLLGCYGTFDYDLAARFEDNAGMYQSMASAAL